MARSVERGVGTVRGETVRPAVWVMAITAPVGPAPRITLNKTSDSGAWMGPRLAEDPTKAAERRASSMSGSACTDAATIRCAAT